MNDEEKLRRLSQTQATTISIRRGAKPELQIHMAATLVMAGDSNSKNPVEQTDMADEICQFVGIFPSKRTGQLTATELNIVFADLKSNVVYELRKRGVLGPGV